MRNLYLYSLILITVWGISSSQAFGAPSTSGMLTLPQAKYSGYNVNAIHVTPQGYAYIATAYDGLLIVDATDVVSALNRLGFDVILKKNADKKTMVDAFRQFGRRLSNSEIGLFYFTGHGMQIKGVNYLIPVKNGIKEESGAVGQYDTYPGAQRSSSRVRASWSGCGRAVCQKVRIINNIRSCQEN